MVTILFTLTLAGVACFKTLSKVLMEIGVEPLKWAGEGIDKNDAGGEGNDDDVAAGLKKNVSPSCNSSSGSISG